MNCVICSSACSCEPAKYSIYHLSCHLLFNLIFNFEKSFQTQNRGCKMVYGKLQRRNKRISFSMKMNIQTTSSERKVSKSTVFILRSRLPKKYANGFLITQRSHTCFSKYHYILWKVVSVTEKDILAEHPPARDSEMMVP